MPSTRRRAGSLCGTLSDTSTIGVGSVADIGTSSEGVSMGRYQRTKGANWERQIVNDLRDYGFDAQRCAPLQTDGLPWPDVLADPLWIECKVGKRPPIIKGMDQAMEHCPIGRIPTVVSKQDRQQPLVTLRWADFLDLLKEWRERAE